VKGFRCHSCGQWHDELPLDLGADDPLYLEDLTTDDRTNSRLYVTRNGAMTSAFIDDDATWGSIAFVRHGDWLLVLNDNDALISRVRLRHRQAGRRIRVGEPALHRPPWRRRRRCQQASRHRFYSSRIPSSSEAEVRGSICSRRRVEVALPARGDPDGGNATHVH
jgi:hypothetical protein